MSVATLNQSCKNIEKEWKSNTILVKMICVVSNKLKHSVKMILDIFELDISLF